MISPYVLALILLVMLLAALFLIFKIKIGMYALQEDYERSNEEKQILIDFLHIIAEDIAKGANKNAVYKRLVRGTAFSCGAMSACVFVKTKRAFVPEAVEGLFPPLAKKLERGGFPTRSDFLEKAFQTESLPLDEGVIANVYNSGKPLYIRNAENDPRIVRNNDDSIKIRSFIAVPITFLGVKFGVMAIVNSIAEKSFSPTIFSLARSLGEQGGLALYNIDGISAQIAKSKMESDLRLASSVQHYLLPAKLPETDKLAFAVKYLPHQLIGGDFYDTIRLPDGKTGVVIADVSGKGVSAAILMAVAQSKLHYIAKMGMSPSQTLIKLNAEIVHSMRTDMFITIAFAVIDADASKVVLARAGHELPILYKAAENRCTEIKSRGMAVGMVEPEIFNEVIEDVEFEMQSGDILVFYTDGLTEAVNADGEEYSAARVMQKITELKPADVAQLNNAVIGDVSGRWRAGTPYDDDLTLLSVKKL